MSSLSFNPTVEPMTYTIEQVNTIAPHDWQSFVLAVTDTFWKLPSVLRPYDGQHRVLTDASGLFLTLAFWSFQAKLMLNTDRMSSLSNVYVATTHFVFRSLPRSINPMIFLVGLSWCCCTVSAGIISGYIPLLVKPVGLCRYVG
ncbi:hypothetical protein [Serratia symbiotica]|uniref:hypothetical protein n=1 Tax=Serratia symbiotica TaxID=138074 RepID=UPI0015D34E76|nr:hypothetical protein [Serratia symbiotica]MBQ0955600.1 hypothetical protein [Serratia symbiotica]